MVKKNKHKLTCRVCELKPEIRDEIDTRMMLQDATNRTLNKFLRSIEVKPPSAIMMNRHRDLEHYKGPDHVPVDVKESLPAHRKIKNELNLFEKVSMNITTTLLPQLAIIPEKLNVLEETQELYVFLKNELAREIEDIRSMPKLYVHPETEEEIYYTPLTKNAKDLIKLMQKQLGEVREVSKGITSDDDRVVQLVMGLMSMIDGKEDQIDVVADLLYQVEDTASDDEVVGDLYE